MEYCVTMAKPPPLNPRSENERVEHAIQAITRDLLTILEVSRDSKTQQWEPPPHHADPTETGDIRRPENLHSDPTGDAATNPSRLYLHDQHDQTAGKLEAVAARVHKLVTTPPKRYGQALDRISIDTRQTAVRFDRAHSQWYGDHR